MEEARTMAAEMAGLTLCVPARATIECVADLKCQLLERLAAGHPLVVDVTAVEEYDAAFLQLLCAASRSAEAEKRQVVILAPEAFQQSVRAVGFAGLAAQCAIDTSAAQEKEERQ